MRKIFIQTINLYQVLVSPLIHTIYGSANVCRFSPTCSEYLKTAVSRYGIIKGLWLGINRIFRCRPGVKGGLDLVK